jgi:hypothetical protein
MRAGRRGAALTVLVVAASACGGGTGDGVPASCGTAEPCGGDLVGTWGPGGSCVNRASLQARYMSELGGACPGGTSVSIVNATSNWAKASRTFNADGSYVGTTTFSASVEILVPSACLVARGCADLDADFRAMVDPVTGIVGSCLNAETACACTIVQQQPTTSQSGTYTVSGTTLTTTPLGGSPADMPYCVSGSELHLITLGASGETTVAGAGTVASDIILVRQ